MAFQAETKVGTSSKVATLFELCRQGDLPAQDQKSMPCAAQQHMRGAFRRKTGTEECRHFPIRRNSVGAPLFASIVE